MMTYILLRNNKESGPLSLDDLRKAGLRANDLVWVEGQSVCWLNPTEIKELKALVGSTATNLIPKEEVKISPAEPVKESPKLVHEEAPLEHKPVNGIIAEPIFTEKTIPVVSDEHERYMPQNEAKEVVIEEELPTYKIDKDTEIVFPNKQGVYKVKEKEVVAETKYNKPLAEIKELYVKSLEQRMKKKGFRLQIPPQVKKVAVYAGILIAGLLVGMLISNKGNNKDTLVQDASQPVNRDNTATITENTQNIPVQDSFVINDPVPYQPQTEDRVISETGNRENPVRESESRIIPSATEPAKSISVSEPVEEKNSKPENEPRAKELSLQEMRSMVSVSSNDYIVGSFGGIKNLELTVTNTSKFNLDHVVVELKYLKPRDELLKAEHISFYSIGANDSKTVSVPKSTRGVKVKYKVIRVESKEISSNTAGL